MISIEEVRIKLTGYPEDVIAHYEAFHSNRDPNELNAFVIGLIQFLQDADNASETTNLSEETNLREDMGVDSITIAEVVFLLEEILEIDIENKDLMEIQTIGQLREYVLRKVS